MTGRDLLVTASVRLVPAPASRNQHREKHNRKHGEEASSKRAAAERRAASDAAAARRLTRAQTVHVAGGGLRAPEAAVLRGARKTVEIARTRAVSRDVVGAPRGRFVDVLASVGRMAAIDAIAGGREVALAAARVLGARARVRHRHGAVVRVRRRLGVVARAAARLVHTPVARLIVLASGARDVPRAVGAGIGVAAEGRRKRLRDKPAVAESSRGPTGVSKQALPRRCAIPARGI